MFREIMKRFSRNQNQFEIEVSEDILITNFSRLRLREDVQEWCFNNKIFVSKVRPNAGMYVGNGNSLLFGPYYVKIYDDSQRILFKLNWG